MSYYIIQLSFTSKEQYCYALRAILLCASMELFMIYCTLCQHGSTILLYCWLSLTCIVTIQDIIMCVWLYYFIMPGLTSQNLFYILCKCNTTIEHASSKYWRNVSCELWTMLQQYKPQCYIQWGRVRLLSGLAASGLTFTWHNPSLENFSVTNTVVIQSHTLCYQIITNKKQNLWKLHQ